MIQSKEQFANAVISMDSQVLDEIHLRTKNIAIYQRDVEHLREELEQLSEQEIEFRASGSSESILSQLNEYLNTFSLKGSAFLEDIAGVLDLFEKTIKSSSLRLLLTTVSTNMCRKFHADVNDLRLLCTYIGPGTLWLPDEAIDQANLQNRKQEFQPHPSHIQQVPTGDLVILKGALYPDAQAILHRSPTIEEAGERRLLLRIDTNEKLDF